MAREWMAREFDPDARLMPVSFVYDGRPHFKNVYGGQSLPPEHVKSWNPRRRSRAIDKARTETTITYTDSKTGLELSVVVVQYSDFPVIEWVAYLKNTGLRDSPFIDGIQALDFAVRRDGKGEFVLHHNAGSFPGGSSYATFATRLERGMLKRLAAFGGRPTNTDMSYVNLQNGDQGIIIAVGWPGQWEATFQRDDRDRLRIRAGQQQTHLRLRPGEEIRTPLIALLFWKGDKDESQNIWRRWMIEHNLPRPGGKPMRPILSAQSGSCTSWMYQATEENQRAFIDRYIQLGIKPDLWWMDTGWYYTQGVPDAELTEEMKLLKRDGRLWERFNIWQYNQVRFPNGIRAVSDYARGQGIGTILWFEPERVTPGSWPERAHPEWCLAASTTDQKLLDLGNPGALKWITERVADVLKTQGVSVFRSDFNMDPLDHWRQNDAPDRQGITENRWVRGYLAFWDGLLARVPGLLIDSCASGGRRNDLETMRRSVPLWRCDYAIEPVGMQCQTYGLAAWLPFFGGSGGQMDPYVFRSNMFPAITKGAWEDRSPGYDVRMDRDYSVLVKLISEWRRVAPAYLGDYYPLTRYSKDETDTWIAWQFQTIAGDQGVIQGFRRRGTGTAPVLRVKLRGLTSRSVYELVDFDRPGTTQATSQTLMTDGLELRVETAPGAAVVAYRRR